MSLTATLKKIIKRHPTGLYITEWYKKKKYEWLFRRYSDREFIERVYPKKTRGLKPDLDHPALFSEKLQWLKLHYRDELATVCSDKAEIKTYLAHQGLGEYAVPTIALYERVEDMDIEALPEQFMLKASHGSGWNVVCRDKRTVDWKAMKNVCRVWLSETLYMFGREWNYDGQTPHIMIEPLLSDEPLVDYKFMCFHGIAKAVQVNHTVDGKECVDMYDIGWELWQEASVGFLPHASEALPKPERYEEMIRIAQTLAQPFAFVRVDMYCVNGKIYVGEMTFFPSAGFLPIMPLWRDRQFGDWLTLPEKNYG